MFAEKCRLFVRRKFQQFSLNFITGNFSATEVLVFCRFVSVTSLRHNMPGKALLFCCTTSVDRWRKPGRIGGGRCTGDGRRGDGKRDTKQIKTCATLHNISQKKKTRRGGGGETKIGREPGLKGK